MLGLEMGVAVGRGLGLQAEPVRIVRLQLPLDARALVPLAAGREALAMVPCSSITPALPARWCSPSTFCVTSPATLPCACSAASA